MISAFILYYLNMKPTHGYEIQKFLQVSNVDQWTKIQSGSIYYALTKLEKDKHIRVLREERTGSRIRKIFEITESGKEELKREMEEVMDMPISNIGSMKFFTDPILGTLSKEDLLRIIHNHILKLKEQKEFWDKWYTIKVDDTTSGLGRLSFEMAISNLDFQLRWHQELQDHIDFYIEESKKTEMIIRSISFDLFEEQKNVITEEEEQLNYALKLKNEILKDPENAMTNLDKIIEQLESKIKKK